MASNAPESTNGVQIGPDIHEDITMVVKAPFRFLKAVVAVSDTGAVNCWFYASQERG